jgi:ubiquinone/menaquinone biosynthesis C-methylase UbiE
MVARFKLPLAATAAKRMRLFLRRCSSRKLELRLMSVSVSASFNFEDFEYSGSEDDYDSEEEEDLQFQQGESDESRRQDNETLGSEFWDNTFQSIDPEDPVEWLLSYDSVGRFFRPYSRDSGRTLCIGCGNSDFSAGLDADKFNGLLSTDFSPVVIKQMKKKYQDLKWEVQDARNMSYKDGSFDVLVDKSLLDCMFYAEDCITALSAMLSEIHRVLKPGGVALFLTVRTPEQVNPLFGGSGSKQLRWKQLSVLPVVAECDEDGQVNKQSRTVAKSLKRSVFKSGETTCELYFYVCQKGDTVSKSARQTRVSNQKFKSFSRKEVKQLGLDSLPEKGEAEGEEQQQEQEQQQQQQPTASKKRRGSASKGSSSSADSITGSSTTGSSSSTTTGNGSSRSSSRQRRR